MNAIKEFKQYMNEIGAEKPEKAYSDLQWEVETVYGKLAISLHESDFTKSGSPRTRTNNYVCIYARFEDTDKAKPYLIQKDANTWSGKWNPSMSGGNNILDVWESCFALFRQDLNQILVRKEILV